jgi:alkylation response protein AidB-like acyl-CoA dehydrogenase
VPNLERALPEIIKGLVDLRMMGMTVPEQYGGGGRDQVSYVLALIELSKGSAAVAGLVASNNSLYGSLLLTYATEDQRRKYLPLCVSGEGRGSFAMIGNAGWEDSHATLERDGKEWVIKEGRSFLLCGVSYAIIPVASEDKSMVASIMVDLENTAGLKQGEVMEQGGIFFSGIAETTFDEARIPIDAMLGGEDDGLHHIQSTLREAWIALAAQAVGIGQAALDQALDAVKERPGAGPIAQVLEWKLADMAVHLDAAELLVLKPAWLKERGKSHENEAAAGKVFAGEAAVKACLEGLQILGAIDPARRPSMEKRMRDAEACRSYYGTGESVGFNVADHLGRGRIGEP